MAPGAERSFCPASFAEFSTPSTFDSACAGAADAEAETVTSVVAERTAVRLKRNHRPEIGKIRGRKLFRRVRIPAEFLSIDNTWLWASVIPAEAGIQCRNPDSRLRGNDKQRQI
jgi:hypothetical protein